MPHPSEPGKSRPARRHRHAARLGVAALCTAAALVLTAGAVSARPGPGPIGTWSGTVFRTDASERNELSFHADGRVCLRTEGGGRGTGTWRATSPTSFGYQVDEQLLDGSGTYFGHVLIDQAARQRGPGFASSGVSQVYGADGGYLGPAEARVVARRTSAVPFSC
jgi:hypothetical protein